MEIELKVLDHGYVKFVDSMGKDESIIEAARMSTGRGFEGWDKDFSLLDFLWRNKHASPFEMCELAIEVQAPLMVFREWHRHRTQSFNEFSARYSEMPNLHYCPDKERFLPKISSNKQESSKVDVSTWPNGTEDALREEVLNEQEGVYKNYSAMLELGVPKEVARLNTPVSRYSKMRAKGNLRNWFNFLNLRMRPNAQKEIVQYANAVSLIVREIWPKAYMLFEEYDLYGASFSRTELTALRMSGALNGLEQAAKQCGLEGRKLTEFMNKVLRGGKEIL